MKFELLPKASVKSYRHVGPQALLRSYLPGQPYHSPGKIKPLPQSTPVVSVEMIKAGVMISQSHSGQPSAKPPRGSVASLSLQPDARCSGRGPHRFLLVLRVRSQTVKFSKRHCFRGEAVPCVLRIGDFLMFHFGVP